VLREMMKSKIHRATITHVDLNYVGSITIDRILMNGANLLPNEKVDVLNVTNGARFSTYVIAGESGSGVIGINGAAARLVSPGDIVIVVAYALVPQEELASFAPSVVFVDEQNCSIMQGDDPLLFSETSRGGLARPAFAEG
jgi:aspartate 1-decarboxylase